MKRFFVRFAFIISLSGFLHAFRVDFDSNFASYSVSHLGVTLFRAERGVAVFLDGAWQTQRHNSLRLQHVTRLSGEEMELGTFHGIQLTWLAGSHDTPFVTTTKTFDSGFDIVFEFNFPNGANGTSLVDRQGNATRDEVFTNFPAFTTIQLPNALSWSGSFVQPVWGYSKGPTGGPTVFFNSSDPELETVVVGSVMNNFKASSSGPGTTWDGITSGWVPGTTGTIRSLEPGFRQRFLLHLGTRGGITAAVAEWGTILQRVHKSCKLPDLTLAKIGYQTDNGAAYTFCAGNCSKTLLEKFDELKKHGVSMGYLSFQGKGASLPSDKNEDARRLLEDAELSEIHHQPQQAAPWCIETWGPDLKNGTNTYPIPLKEFQKALGVPLQLYTPYFCPSSRYFHENNPSSPWGSVSSNTSLTGCNSFGFLNVESKQSRHFYDWFLAKGRDVGMVSFETDFMNQNYNCVPRFIHSPHSATMFLRGMAAAALNSNVTIQWCYATPTDVLASLDMPTVTNFRVSFDFCYGESWKIGASSLLVWALGAAPSKDTLWSTDNNHTIVPGCSWTPDHESPAAELHLVLALMSMGPVGISDALGLSNATLVKRTITQDGTLLKPSKSLTTVDSLLAKGDTASMGQVYGTFSNVGGTVSHQFVSFQLVQEFPLLLSDFFPPLNPSKSLFVQRTFDRPCQNGDKIGSCATLMNISTSVVALPKSDLTNRTGGTDFKPAITTTWPVCEASGWVLLGDLGKYVPLSPQRFSNVICTQAGISFVVKGSPGEVVPVSLLPRVGSVDSKVLKIKVVVGDCGVLTANCQHDNCDVGSYGGLVKL